jgi:hypothetical protein
MTFIVRAGERHARKAPTGAWLEAGALRLLPAGERLPPEAGDHQPCHRERPPTGMRGPWRRGRESVQHQAAQGLDGEPCASMIASVAPFGEAASIRSARFCSAQRSLFVVWLFELVGTLCAPLAISEAATYQRPID